MNKAELIAFIAEKAGLTKADMEVAFKATFETITEIMAKQDKVTILVDCKICPRLTSFISIVFNEIACRW